MLGVVTRERPLMIILEYMAHGSLRDFLRNSKPSPEGVLEILPNEMAQFACDIAMGMEFLSSKGFVHRDLAARFVCDRDEEICLIVTIA